MHLSILCLPVGREGDSGGLTKGNLTFFKFKCLFPETTTLILIPTLDPIWQINLQYIGNVLLSKVRCMPATPQVGKIEIGSLLYYLFVLSLLKMKTEVEFSSSNQNYVDKTTNY